MKKYGYVLKNKALFALCLAASVLMLVGCPKITPTPNAVYYTVSFETGIEGVTFNDIEVPANSTVNNLDSFVLEDNNGRFFAGWLCEGKIFTKDTKVTKDITLVPHWEVEVVFDAGEGSFKDGKSVKVRFDAGKTVDAPKEIPFASIDEVKQEEYAFDGWYNGEEKFDFENSSVNSSITLVAKYKTKKYYNVTFVYSAEKYVIVRAYENEEVVLPEDPVQEGKVFIEWRHNGTKLGTVIYNVSVFPVWGYEVTINFNNGAENHTIVVEEGNTLPPVTPFVRPGYKFKHWYTTECEIPFNMNSEINSAVTLNALWLAEIKEMKSVSNGKVVLELYVDDYDWENFTFHYMYANGVKVDPTDDIIANGKELTIFFNKIIPDKDELCNFVYDADGKKFEATFSIIPVTDSVNFTYDETRAILSWAPVEGVSEFEVTYYEKNSSERISKLVKGTSHQFNGLKFKTDYVCELRSVVRKQDGGLAKSVAQVFEQRLAIKSDYLMLMYMDGDNNLNDPIYIDMNEVEYGLSFIRNKDGSAKEDYSSVNVVALWDGYTGDSETKVNYGTPGSHLYRLGADDRDTLAGWTTLGENTIDLSSTADWLEGNEVNMADRNTVVNFYKWALQYYEADHIYLQFSNHGAGTRALREFSYKDEMGITHTHTSEGRRAMCADDTNGNDGILHSKDIPLALKEAGMPKVDIIMEDVCLGGNVEEAYELKDCAKYLLASPNNIPGMGFDYANLLYNGFREGITPELFGRRAVDIYKQNYTMDEDDWNKLFKKNSIIPSKYDPELLTRFFGDSCSTLSFYDLSKVEGLKTAISDLAEEITKLGDDKIIPVTNYNTNKDENISLSTALKQSILNLNFRDYSVGYPQNMYMGSYVWECDIGFVLNDFYTFANYAKNEDLKTKINAAYEALDKVVLYAWKDGYKKPTYYYGAAKIDDVYYGRIPCGLTIGSGTLEVKISGNNATLLKPKCPSWYSTELQFGKDNKWYDLMINWFGLSN